MNPEVQRLKGRHILPCNGGNESDPVALGPSRQTLFLVKQIAQRDPVQVPSRHAHGHAFPKEREPLEFATPLPGAGIAGFCPQVGSALNERLWVTGQREWTSYLIGRH